MAEKIKVSLYKMDHEREMSDLINKLNKEKYLPVDLLEESKWDYSLWLYYHKERANPPYWKNFLDSSQIIDNTKNPNILTINKFEWWNESFIFTISISSNIYFVTWGQWHNIIKDFIQDDFGMDILSRLITDDEHILRAVREKYIVWGMIWSSKFFRKNYNFLENESFWKIYQELKANLDKKIIKQYFWFNEEDLNCIATSSFSLNKSTDFNQLFQLIDWCEDIMKIEPKIIFNSVIKITKSKNTDLINYLEKWLILRIQKADHYLCNENFEDYLLKSKKYRIDGTSYFDQLEFDRVESVNDILQRVVKDKEDPDKVFFDKILKLDLFSLDENDKILTRWKLFNHILWEYELTDDEFKRINIYRDRNSDKRIQWKNYFFIDWNWYQIKDKFIDDLNHSCGSFILNNFEEDFLGKKWVWIQKTKKKDDVSFKEWGFNEAFIWENNTIVLDRVLVDGIEICDILKYDKDNLYIVHVKKGFDQNMRDLSHQLAISASRIIQDKADDYKIIWELYDSLSNKKTSKVSYFIKASGQVDKYTREEFINLFKKNIVFVLAFMDPTNRNIITSIEEKDKQYKINAYGSNIAKFSLNNLVKSMKENDCEFKITQIFNQIQKWK